MGRSRQEAGDQLELASLTSQGYNARAVFRARQKRALAFFVRCGKGLGFHFFWRWLRPKILVRIHARRIDNHPAYVPEIGAVEDDCTAQRLTVLLVAQFQSPAVELGAEEICGDAGRVDAHQLHRVLNHAGVLQALLKRVVFDLLETFAVNRQFSVQSVEAGGVVFFQILKLQLQRKDASLLGISSLAARFLLQPG